MASINLKTANLNLGTATSENKALAQKILDEATNRKITLDTAQKTLDALGQKIQDEHNATQANINQSNASRD